MARNILSGPGWNQWDMTFMKYFQIREGFRLQARVDALNVFNQVTFGAPNLVPTNAAFGAVTVQRNVPRRLQAMLRLQF